MCVVLSIPYNLWNAYNELCGLHVYIYMILYNMLCDHFVFIYCSTANTQYSILYWFHNRIHVYILLYVTPTQCINCHEVTVCCAINLYNIWIKE